MNRLIKSTLFAALALLISGRLAVAADQDAEAIRGQLKQYEAALNASDTDSVMKLYAEDAVFMPQNSQPFVGREAVKTAYVHVFHTIKLDVQFLIDEVRPIAPNWAYARTRSVGTQRLLTGDGRPETEGNQELFVLHKEADGQWRFARYIFSTTNPASTH
jgi:uncharacterized protein (TIGR02246 family)